VSEQSMFRKYFQKFEKLNERFIPRLFITISVMIGLILCYLFLNNSLEHKVDLLLPIDEMIPYWPWTISIYLTLYVMYFSVSIILETKRFTQVLIDIVLMILISFVFFTLITSHYPRPAPEAWAHSLWKPVIDLMVSVDAPGNTCPSLHVSTSIYLALVMRKSRYGIPWLFWGLLVSLSTLSLKQHFVWDWIGGIILAFFVINLNAPISKYLQRLRS
jgi:membrane-associated phospholipid phosphatase